MITTTTPSLVIGKMWLQIYKPELGEELDVPLDDGGPGPKSNDMSHIGSIVVETFL